jgi:hypothetical protein
MQRARLYPESGRVAEQLSTLAAIGIFDTPPEPVTAPLADPSDVGAAIGDRARSYLHVNCSYCHQPSGPTGVTMDLRLDVPLSQTGICNVTPSRGDLGLADMRIVAPGSPEHSVLLQRALAVGGSQMPPLARRTVDASGGDVLSRWITSLDGCAD